MNTSTQITRRGTEWWGLINGRTVGYIVLRYYESFVISSKQWNANHVIEYKTTDSL